MSDALFSTLDLDNASTTRAGYRLHHLEIFNWGTFDGRVWQLRPEGDTALLTGDIGSGKSTLVDALTTLLLPAHRIAYNKAAGAEARERTLRSYVEGHYKSERVESTGASRAIGLRDHRTYSVVLGVFVNEGHDETVTLAQVFHARDRAGQPDRFFVTAGKALSIAGDFTDFGSDLNDLRRRLRGAGAEIATTYPEYSSRMRRLLAIRSDQAMDLFHQTVSMKSVGNLNDFVRHHMLEPSDASSRIREIVAHFEDLTKAHEAVRRARDQLAALEPLCEAAGRYDQALARRAAAEGQRDAVRLFVAELRLRLTDQRLAADGEALAAQGRRVGRGRERLVRLRADREGLIEERARAGGQRLAELARTAEAAEEQARLRRERRTRFEQQVRDAGLAPVDDAAGFDVLRGRLASVGDETAARRGEVDTRRGELLAQRGEDRRRGEELRAELTSLAGRRSNLPVALVDLRAELCADLGLDHAALPFAGELLDVRQEHAAWRGAAERVLRGFAQSLLVPHEHYDTVAAWVNGRRLTHLRRDGSRGGVRLVYERVAPRRVALRPVDSGGALLLADTVETARGPFADYLAHELVARADHRCVESLEAFRHEHRAVTREGQVRSGDRHEKDDRSRVDDARTWVLGWANEAKIAALTEQLGLLQTSLLAVEGELEDLDGQRAVLDGRASALAKLEEHTSWRELDWQAARAEAHTARAERERLLAESSRLHELEGLLEANATQTAEAEGALRDLEKEVSRLESRIASAERVRERDTGVVAEQDPGALATARATYDALGERLGPALPTDPDLCEEAGSALTRDLQRRIDGLGKELGGYTQSLLAHMHEVRRRWPEATMEMDAGVEARGEYLALRDRVASDDLPRFEAEFARQLRTNTIRELAQLNSWLRRQAEDIHERVERINEALGAIDYSPEHSIALVAERTSNTEVQAFRTDLRAATDDALAPEGEHYSEQRFADVQRILERFRGREGHTEADRAWTRRVTDVRTWFSFSASERHRETGVEREHYRDSDGKSGGQKEKLAYTILAASLAYQFGLDWGAERSRDFRFAVIDEAFGRGSDASTRYALELFAKLGLQLLIVTPLQKVHVIEPYVRAIGFVDNPTGSASRLRTLSIEEFHHRRDTGA